MGRLLPTGTLGLLDRDQPDRRRDVGLHRHERHLDLGGFLVRVQKGLDRRLQFDGQVGEGEGLGVDGRIHDAPRRVKLRRPMGRERGVW